MLVLFTQDMKDLLGALNIISLNDLLEVKRCSKRLKDQADAEELRNRNNSDLQ